MFQSNFELNFSEDFHVLHFEVNQSGFFANDYFASICLEIKTKSFLPVSICESVGKLNLIISSPMSLSVRGGPLFTLLLLRGSTLINSSLKGNLSPALTETCVCEPRLSQVKYTSCMSVSIWEELQHTRKISTLL